ncbi:uncharacterized protein LOC119981150 isoform X2 [Tripterygium wilfordii]|uniref:uncharacterized protein LOC119981150 isoform X2 n=1 Tax=Tripterygium wilfordii TaxID=458696 RepID=UPI0018F844C0|nr:uncharacterized protein LOC119981150 isoform X2 [Tripterygium wilfordii]
MTLNLLTSPSPWLSPFLPNSTLNLHSTLLFSPTHLSTPRSTIRASSARDELDGVASSSTSSLEDNNELLTRLSGAKDADQVLEMMAENLGRSGGSVSVSDCCSIIRAALNRNNPDLALAVLHAMRCSGFYQGGGGSSAFVVDRWKWPRPDVRVYTVMVKGLAALLRVSDALGLIEGICRVGLSTGEEIVSCAKCCYQYELVSGDIVTIDSEEISMDVPAWKRGLKFLQLANQSIPAAVHSIVVQTPSGMARTHRFATETVDLPAQQGERVSIASAAPSTVYREVGPFRFSPKVPNFYPGEPMCLTNHKDGREALLLRAPPKDGNSSLLKPSTLIPLLAVLATADTASGIIDPSLPKILSVAAVTSLAVGATFNTLVLPQLSRLPERSLDVIAMKQQLLSQYDMLQSRIKGLKDAAEKEVWMLARMCQLDNKIFAVGEPSYRARRSKVKRVREGLENSLRGRIELIDNYARISSMIEIEVEMDSDVLAAEAVSNAESIAEQIQQTMELENLDERWRLQAEANDEAERLLSSQPIPTEQV